MMHYCHVLVMMQDEGGYLYASSHAKKKKKKRETEVLPTCTEMVSHLLRTCARSTPRSAEFSPLC